MKPVYTVEQVRAAEQATGEALTSGRLMAQAAAGLAREVRAELADHNLPLRGARLLLVVGPGDNGGDGLFAGAQLARFTADGALTSLQIDGLETICGPVRMHLWKPLIDNHRKLFTESWELAGLDQLSETLISGGFSHDVGSARMHRRTELASPNRDIIVHCDYEYRFFTDRVEVAIAGSPLTEFAAPIPAIGLDCLVNPALTEVEWYGRGPGENYPDSVAAALVGRYRQPASGLVYRYAFPQDTGNRCDIRWLKLLTPEGQGVRIGSETLFNFSLWPWTAAAVDAARHRNELADDPEIRTLNLDHRVLGLGSASCGPETGPQYQVHLTQFAFSFVLSAVN
jgi:evolved beta-galactosidase subunit alpha